MEDETCTDHLPHKSFAEMIDDFGSGHTHHSLVGGVIEESRPEDSTAGLLKLWWVAQAHEDAELVSQKYQEYGNTALLEVGRQLCDVAGLVEPTKAQMQMMGIWFFMTGKMARWKTAILKGVPVSDDTLDDLAVYSFMARRTQEKGGWPDAG